MIAIAKSAWWVAIGSAVGDSLQALGDFTSFVGRTLVWLLTSRPQTRTLVPVAFTIGYQSVFVIILTGFFIGMVLAVQSFHHFQKLGFSTLSGPIINMSVVRGVGPGPAGTVFARRIGQPMGAEAAAMPRHEQIRALSRLRVHP